MRPTSEAHPVHPLPRGPASAAKLGLVEALQQVVPTERAIDPGTIVLGLLLDPLRGRSPLDRWAEGLAPQATARRVGQAGAPEAWQADPVGRGLERRYDPGTMTGGTACAVRAAQGVGVDKRSGPWATTSGSVEGAALPPKAQQDQPRAAVPLTLPPGESTDQRPALQPWGFSTLWVGRGGPP